MVEAAPAPRAGPGDAAAEEVAAAIRVGHADLVPHAAIVLGSGLGPAVEHLRVQRSLAYSDLPALPAPTVPGHEGRLLLGELAGVSVVVFSGRSHYYEGNDMSVCTMPPRVARALGVRTLIVTAAVGGLDESLHAGSIVVGRDHLNFMGVSPLRGWHDAGGSPSFVELSQAYDAGLRESALVQAAELGVPAVPGVYAALAGPSYETPAETAFLRGAGATVVGMSVVPEVVAARALGMRVLALFAVANEVGHSTSHEEVLRVSGRSAVAIGEILEAVLPHMSEEGERR
jgi:purine-nucleoside phosphorylase